jgi:phytoene synthase
MSIPLDESYHWATRVARSRAKNFYYSFLLLDAQRRKAMCAIYAFMRICDDLSDEPGPKTEQVFHDWRREMEAALAGRFSTHPLWPAFHDAATRFRIPHEYFHQMIDGVQSDIVFRPIETFDQLYQYCYRVASVVGLTVVHVLGFQKQEALPLAEKCGIAFQLTNILRDVKEDFGNGRVYLPEEDRKRFAVSATELGADRVSENLRKLLEFEGDRAARYYQDSRPLLDLVAPEGRRMLSAIIEIYYTLFERIRARRYEVLAGRVSVPTVTKVWILTKTALSRP